jgi:hypothetical protein
MKAWLTTSCRPVPTATPRTTCRRRTGPDRGTGQPTARIIPARSTATPSAARSPTPLLRPGRAATARPPWTASTLPPRCRTHQGPTSAVRCRNSPTCPSPRTGRARASPRNRCRHRRTRVAATCPKRPDRRPTQPSTASLRVVPSTANRRGDRNMGRRRGRPGTANHREVPSTANRPNTTRRRNRIRIPVPSGASPMHPSRVRSGANPMHPNRAPSGANPMHPNRAPSGANPIPPSRVHSEPTPTPTGKTPTRSATTPTHTAVARTGPVSPATVDPLPQVRHRTARHRTARPRTARPRTARHRTARHRLDRGPTGQVRLRRVRADTALEARRRLLTVLAVSPSRTRSRAVPVPMDQAALDQLAMDTAAMELARLGVATDPQATVTGPTGL